MFWNFPYFFVTILSLCIMHEKNYTFIMTIYCDYLNFKKTLKFALFLQ